MGKIYVNELKKYYEKEIEFQGTIDNIRDFRWGQFVILKDSTGKVQMTIEKNAQNEKINNVVKSLTNDSTVKVIGVLHKAPKVKMGGMEIVPKHIEVTSKSSDTKPFDYNNLENVKLDTRLDYRFLDLRNERNSLIIKVQNLLNKYLREYLYKNGFIEIHTPKIIGTASESGSEVFELKYFDKKAYLAQSPQFYKQMAISSGLDRVFEVAPCFRAENSNTSKHATEFTSFDVEFAYIENYRDVMNLESEMIRYAFTHVKSEIGNEIKRMFNIDLNIPDIPFPTMKLEDVYKELEERYGYNVEQSEKVDLTTEAERLCRRLAKDKFNHEFLFVTDFPADKRAFYHMRDKNGNLQGYDLIWKGIEITTGAQRENRYLEIKKNAESKKLYKDVEFYLEFFKYGCPPHGGFAIGLERLTMLLLDIPTIKEAMFIFRGPTRIRP
mgnify:FL=1